MDVTDIIEYNFQLLGPSHLAQSFFCTDRDDPTKGFAFDATTFAGHTYPAEANLSVTPESLVSDALLVRLALGSHFARHVGLQLDEQKGYTSTVGVSTTKVLSKLVGNVNKPQGQTTLLPPYEDAQGTGSNALAFLDTHEIGKIPGIGFKMAQKVREYILQRPAKFNDGLVYGKTKENITVNHVRCHPSINAEQLEKILAGPGAPHGIGTRIWDLVNGLDDTQVGAAREVPRQISLEDSYIRLDTMEEVLRELRMLSTSLVKRMRIDLLESDDDDPGSPGQDELQRVVASSRKRWMAHPKTLRLTTRPRPPMNADGTRTRTFTRISRSGPLPNFVFGLDVEVGVIVDKLVNEALVPLFRRLHPEKSGWNLSLMNVAVTNMANTASDSKAATGRDIGKMFKKQDNVLKDFRIVDEDDPPDLQMASDEAVNNLSIEGKLSDIGSPTVFQQGSEELVSATQESVPWDQDDIDEGDPPSITCEICGATMPAFAIAAHTRFHDDGT